MSPLPRPRRCMSREPAPFPSPIAVAAVIVPRPRTADSVSCVTEIACKTVGTLRGLASGVLTADIFVDRVQYY